MANTKTVATLSPNDTYFPVPSLYYTLTQSDVQIIERILASDFVAPAPEMETHLAALNHDLKAHPVTVIARSINLLYLWEFRAVYDLLHGFVSRQYEGLDGGPQMALLVQALLAYADVTYNRSFELARACLVGLKGVLTPLCLEDYTDLTV